MRWLIDTTHTTWSRRFTLSTRCIGVLSIGNEIAYTLQAIVGVDVLKRVIDDGYEGY